MDDTNQQAPSAADAGTQATSEPQPNVPSNIRELAHACALPEIAFDAPWWRTKVEAGAIEHFMDDSLDPSTMEAARRQMAVVSDASGALRKLACPDEVA